MRFEDKVTGRLGNVDGKLLPNQRQSLAAGAAMVNRAAPGAIRQGEFRPQQLQSARHEPQCHRAHPQGHADHEQVLVGAAGAVAE